MKTLSDFTLISQPGEQPRSADFEAWINGEPLDVLLAEKADFAVFECAGPVEVRVRATGSATGAAVRPLGLGVEVTTLANELGFTLDGPRCVCVDVPGRKPLFIYANGPEADRPEPDAPGVRFYAAGRVHEAGEIVLRAGETLYIEAGAVVRGCVIARLADGVTIRGRGVLDGSFYDYNEGARRRSIVLDRCVGATVRDIVMIEPSSWMLVIGGCREVRVEGLKQIGSCMSSDGIDICGSSDVVIEGCCLRNDDDNIAIKAGDFNMGAFWGGDVRGIRVRRCIFLNGTPGNVMEIGYELRTNRVSDVVFEDIDVLNAHGEGAVFSIHNGDRAVVEDILWDNIRVEHYWDKLVDLRVVFSRYNHDVARGRIRGVRLRNIRVAHSRFNPGCSVSLIGGYSPEAPVSDVVFENFFLNDAKVLGPDALELHTRNAEGVRFI